MAEEVEGQGRGEHVEDYVWRDDDLPSGDLTGFADPGGHSNKRNPFPRPPGAEDPAGEPGKRDPFPRPKNQEQIYEEWEGEESNQS